MPTTVSRRGGGGRSNAREAGSGPEADMLVGDATAALLTLEGANSWRVVKAREPSAFANPPVIRLAKIGPSRAAPKFLLRRQVCDDIAVRVNKIGIDAATVLKPAAMLADRRSVIWVTLDPVGVAVPKRDDSK